MNTKIMFTKNSTHHYDYFIQWECYAPEGSVYVPEIRDDGGLRLSSGYEELVKEVLDQNYPLPGGLEWQFSPSGYGQVNVQPSPIQGENPFKLMQEGRENEIWLELHPFDKKNPSVGDLVRARERGGYVYVMVEAVLQFRSYLWVRGRWSNGQYLPVEEFLQEMPTVDDLAHHRVPSDKAWQGSAA